MYRYSNYTQSNQDIICLAYAFTAILSRIPSWLTCNIPAEIPVAKNAPKAGE